MYDSYAFRKFMKVDFLGEEQAPDATTLCKFRKLLNENGITKLLFDAIRNFLEKHGRLMHGGTIVDATIIEAPTSTIRVAQGIFLAELYRAIVRLFNTAFFFC